MVADFERYSMRPTCDTGGDEAGYVSCNHSSESHLGQVLFATWGHSTQSPQHHTHGGQVGETTQGISGNQGGPILYQDDG